MRSRQREAASDGVSIAWLACGAVATILVLGYVWTESQIPVLVHVNQDTLPIRENAHGVEPPGPAVHIKVDPPKPIHVDPEDVGAGIWNPNFEAVVNMHAPDVTYTKDHRYLPLHLTEKWRKKKQLTFWSSDFHIAPVEDIRHLFKEMGVNLIIKSLSGHCHLTGTCATDLRVLNGGLYDTPDNDLYRIRKAFFDAYKDDPLMKTVDAFICFHAVFVCEFFVPFNKSIIVLSSTRYEGGRESAERWNILNEFLQKIAKQPRNLLGANNLYDAAYLHYFTGVRTAFVPSYCGYMSAKYNPTRPEILIVTKFGPTEGAIQAAAAKAKSKYKFAHYRNLYHHYKYEDLAAHPAIVNMPYQVSVMSYFEHYRMCIPMFFPSPAFLGKLHHENNAGVMGERTWSVVRGQGLLKTSRIPKFHNVSIPQDPNNEQELAAVQYWTGYADFYLWPHITLYDDWDDLMVKLDAADFARISKKMCAHNEKSKDQIKAQWAAIFARVEKDVPAEGNIIPQDYDKALREL